MPKKRVLLGVTGGIAAYKIAYLVRLLTVNEYEVKVVMSRHATEFIAPLTFKSLSANPVFVEQFEPHADMAHIELADWADVCLVAPATANIIAKLASGIADDLISTTLITLDCPLLVAPAMNTRMYNHPATQQNLQTLESRGVHIIEPGEGSMACNTIGIGRLPEPEVLFDWIEVFACVKKDLEGKKILVSAGPTREWLDPFRFISNPASGKMGLAIARAARMRSADVTLVMGPTHLQAHVAVTTIRVESAQEMLTATKSYLSECDILIMAAAVSDFRPKEKATQKIKKVQMSKALVLERNPDILAELATEKGERIFVGFSAETENILENAADKLRRKHLDLIIANDVSRKDAGFAVDTNQVIICRADGTHLQTELLSKQAIAHLILDEIVDVADSGKLRK